ncbi:hypothetical protein KTR9_2869 [Gordonia sp. KTR9]|nr:hypothetical protein KTR9_2869 [Gordonia sp. KTR9]
MTTWDEVEVGNHQFQIGGLESDPTTIAAETDVFTVSRSGLLIVHTGISAGPATVGVDSMTAPRRPIWTPGTTSRRQRCRPPKTCT